MSDTSRHVQFHAINGLEKSAAGNRDVNPVHRQLVCGECGQPSNFRVICDLKREADNATVQWAICNCPKEEPAVVIEKAGNIARQIPEGKEFTSGDDWPDDLSRLFDEAARCHAAAAYTAAAMTARKVLMAVACDKGADEGKTFVAYVDFILATVLPIPDAKDAISRIKDIGNEANHRLKFVAREDARRSLSIVNYLLNAVYAIPRV